MARAKQRQTANVTDIKKWANEFLANPNVADAERHGVCRMLEEVLHSTGNYAGFGWVHWMNEGGFDRWYRECDHNEPAPDAYVYGPGGRENNEYRRVYF